MKNTLAFLSIAAALAVGAFLGGPSKTPKPAPVAPVEIARSESAKGNHAAAADRLRAFIRTEGGLESKKSAVRTAALNLGYIEAKSGDWKQARETFLAVAKDSSEQGSHADFGSASDQGAYQAIVCLAAEGKTKEAQREFRQFLKDRKTSPLAGAAFKRLVRLSGGEPLKEDIALYETATQALDSKVKRETAMCGPKALDRMFQKWRLGKENYREIAKAATTSESGTTVEGMLGVLAAKGVAAKAQELNITDFRALRPPAVWLSGTHYVLIEKITHGIIHIYDPLDGQSKQWKMPDARDGKFRATVITIQIPPGATWASAPTTKPLSTSKKDNS